jgi:hypothetical protein
MALKPLTPGYLPLGQFDLLDSVTDLVGGEVGILAAATSGDFYAADVEASSLFCHLTTGSAVAGNLYGLIDEGSSGYGTLYGTVIGGTVGKRTGFSEGAYVTTSTAGAVVVGPSTHYGSGKATLWTMPGLYGVTADAFEASGKRPAAVNAALYGSVASGKVGKLTTDADNAQVATFVQSVSDSSLVSTTAAAATGASLTAPEYYAVYLLGASRV